MGGTKPLQDKQRSNLNFHAILLKIAKENSKVLQKSYLLHQEGKRHTALSCDN